MKPETIDDLREEVERVLRAHLKQEGVEDTGVTVTVLPSNTLRAVVVTALFEDWSTDQRFDWFWSVLESEFEEKHLERMNVIELMSLNEAKTIFPDWVKPRFSRTL